MSAETLPVEALEQRRKYDDPAIDEAEMLTLLERHFARPGNGGSGEYAFLRHVRNAAGHDAKRTFDAVAVGLWQSRGHDIHVIEVKVSRSDLLRELNKPDKAEDAAKVADRFSIAAPRGICTLAELPATWGYIEVSGGVEEFEEIPDEGVTPAHRLRRVTGRKVKVARRAPLLRSAEDCKGPVPRTFLVPLLRAAGAVPDPVPHHEALTRAAVDKAVREARDLWEERARRAAAEDAAALRLFSDFKRLAGLYWLDEEGMRRKAREVRAAMQSAESPIRVLDSLRRMQREIANAVKALERRTEAAVERAEPEGATP